MATIPELAAPEMLDKLDDLAAYFKVPAAVHPEDLLFKQFLLQTPGIEAADRYFSSGYGDADWIAMTIKRLLPNMQRPKVLEFAAGFGRVSRHLLHQAPNIDFTVSDIHPSAVQFAKETLGLTGFKSEARPEQLILPARYDFIFTLSFFSHMPDSTFGAWLALLYSALNEGGLLLFTTHGEVSMRKYTHLADSYDPETGCGFTLAGSDQIDIEEGESYGSAATDFEYVLRRIRKTPAYINSYRSGQWWGHQDEWIIQKPGCNTR
jgi:SAM-dependent methyltransferase